MTNYKLNDLLQEWAAARIRFSSEHGHRFARLAKIVNRISEVEHECQPSALECTSQTKARPSGKMLRKGPARVSIEVDSRSRRGNLK